MKLALFGDPVDGSQSPQIQTHLLRLAGIDGIYEARRVDAGGLADGVEDLRTGKLSGANVTMPHKESAVGLCDRLSPSASRALSVNTLRVEDGLVEGISTDSLVVGDLLSQNRFAAAKAFLILGTGGAARAAISSVPDGAIWYVSGRTEASASRLAAEYGGSAVPWGAAVIGAVVVNATPLGSRGEALPGEILRTAGGLIDLPYASSPTPSVTSSRELGLPVCDGHEFLLRQALRSFEAWTGRHFSYEEVSSDA